MNVFKSKTTAPGRALRGFILVAIIMTPVLTGCDQVKRIYASLSGASSGEMGVSRSEESEVEVGTYTLKPETVELTRELIGRTRASNTAEVRPQVNGVVLERLFEEGSLVEKDRVLYHIDDNVYRANYEKAQARYDNLSLIKDRYFALKEKEATSEQSYEEALYNWKVAGAELELAKLDLDYCQIKAPISGRIGLSEITVGALVTNGQPNALTTIQQVDPIYVDMNPSIRTLLETVKLEDGDPSETKAEFFMGAKATLILEEGWKYPFDGKVTLIDNRIQEDLGALTIRAEFPNPEQVMIPGMFVRVFLTEGVRENALLIPQQALFRTPAGDPYVWVVGQDSTAEQRPVVSNRVLGNMALIDSGLKAGERVVVEGVQHLAKGAKVSAKEITDLPNTTTLEPSLTETLNEPSKSPNAHPSSPQNQTPPSAPQNQTPPSAPQNQTTPQNQTPPAPQNQTAEPAQTDVK